LIHPSTTLSFINEQIGFGVIATERIPRGTIVWALDVLDRVIPDRDVHLLPQPFRPQLDRYAYRDHIGNWVLCWDHARFVNHSCEPTMLAPGLGFEIALRDIEPGEQLTDDYATLNLDEDMPCACGSPQCRSVVRALDYETLVPLWDDISRAAWAHASKVEQPLWPVLSAHDREQAQRALRDPALLPSIMHLRYQRPMPVSARSSRAS
jgi:hypothetical protein